ncbi:MAG: hypothetical protein RJA81_617 [Planctomycetota bacterium]
MVWNSLKWSRLLRVTFCFIILVNAGCAKNKSILVNNRPVIEGASPLVADNSSGVVVQKPSGNRFVDRHPILYKPGEYYTTSDGNVVVRGARATFVGIPAGFVGEFKQAFRGVPKTVVIH